MTQERDSPDGSSGTSGLPGGALGGSQAVGMTAQVASGAIEGSEAVLPTTLLCSRGVRSTCIVWEGQVGSHL